MVPAVSRARRNRADKPKRREVQPVDKRFNEAYRVVGSDVIVNRLREKEQLGTVVTGKMSHAGF
jgi:hypothetical protein